MGILSKIFHELDGIKFLLRNIKITRKLPIINSKQIGKFVIEPGCKKDLKDISILHKSLRDGRDLNIWRKILYRGMGKKLIFLLKDSNKRVIGFEMFYFKDYEIENRIIHEAFIGIDKEYRQNNLSVHLREYSINHFSNTNLTAISTNIPAKNKPSIISAKKSGFKLCKERIEKGDYQFFYYFKKNN
tara:strand:- start:601 stop:1161 length:561 start_codon:yes stop_codon:yes gene_type:complete